MSSKQLTLSDLSRQGLMWIIGHIEISPLPSTERVDSALAAMERHVEIFPEDLDRYVLDTPASEYRPTNLRSVDLADYQHAGFKVTLHPSTSPVYLGKDVTPVWTRDYHNDPHHNDLP